MGTETAQNPTPTTTPATDASPFHVIPGHETIQAAPKSVYQAGPSGAAHGKAGSMGSAAPEKSFVGENIDKLTEPIENYTPAGRAEHPILSRLGDVTRGVKELLEGGQAAGKPMGTSSGVVNNPVTGVLLPEDQALIEGEGGMAAQGAKAEELAREYAPKVASHLAETGHNFLTGMLEDARAGFEATAPEGSTEAGFAKIPGYRKEGPAPELPKKPKAVTKPAKLKPPVEVNPEAEATKKAEDDLAAARANYVHDMEKNPTTLPKGTPVHEQVVYVDPNKVIAKVNPGGNTFDEPTVQKYQRMIRNGEDIPAARIEYGKTGDLRGYDGRHRVEAARREGAPVKLWTRREVEPGEAPPTTIGHEEPQVHELNGDETPESANGNIPESQQAATEEEGAPPDAVGVHPDDLPRQARYQDVNWEAPDLQDTGKRVNEQTIRKDYASGSTKPSIYQSYIPMEDLPTGSVDEDFDREDYRAPRNGGSPIKVQVNPDNSLEILDGNHRAITWDEQDKTHAPAWVVDYRHPNIENISEDEKAERAEEAEAQATAPEAEEGAYHPDLQALADKHGVTDDPYKISHGSSVITPDGKFIHGGGIRAYHGTASTKPFTEFETEGRPTDEEGNPLTSGSGADPTSYLGAHFAKEPNVANKFATRSESWMKSRYEAGDGEEGAAGPRVMPVDLNFKNPKNFGSERNMRDYIYSGDLTNSGYAGDELLNKVMEADGIENPEDGGEETDKWIDRYQKDADFRKEQNNWLFEHARRGEGEENLLDEAAQHLAADARARMQAEGYDGAIYKNEVEGGTGYVAFHPHQINSPFVNQTGAIRTHASFDPATGHVLDVTVPNTGVSPDQVDALKHATSQALGNGKSGKVVIHLADGTKYAERPNASAATIEPALKALGVHPNSYVGSQAEKLPVNSSHIQHWGYDPKADTLHVTFKDGGEYRMNGVSGQTWAALQKDTSPGKAFNRLVRGKYTGQKTK